MKGSYCASLKIGANLCNEGDLFIQDNITALPFKYMDMTLIHAKPSLQFHCPFSVENHSGDHGNCNGSDYFDGSVWNVISSRGVLSDLKSLDHVDESITCR